MLNYLIYRIKILYEYYLDLFLFQFKPHFQAKMFVCNLCILLFVCDTALSFIQLPCLTNESRDFSYAKQVLKELNTYMNSQIQQSRNILHNLKANAAQKIKKAENALTNGIDSK